MKAKRRIAWLLSFLMVFSLIMGTSKMQVFANSGMVVFAEGTNIEESDYVKDEDGVFVYCAVDDTAYGTITVPEGYVFLVEDGVNVTADAIVLEGGAQLSISGGGKMNCSESVVGTRLPVRYLLRTDADKPDTSVRSFAVQFSSDIYAFSCSLKVIKLVSFCKN